LKGGKPAITSNGCIFEAKCEKFEECCEGRSLLVFGTGTALSGYGKCHALVAIVVKG
jgi:hypothetical protein